MSKSLVHGYPERMSAKAGESLNIMLSAVGCEAVSAILVRLIHGDEHPEGPGFKEEVLGSVYQQNLSVTEQGVQKGNFLCLVDPVAAPRLGSTVTLHAFVYPTLLGVDQIVLAHESVEGRGYRLAINSEGKPSLRVGSGEVSHSVTSPTPLILNTWYLLTATLDGPSGEISISQEGMVNRYNSQYSRVADLRLNDVAALTVGSFALPNEVSLVIVGGRIADGRICDCFNGKIDRPGLVGKTLSESDRYELRAGRTPGSDIIAFWDTSAGYSDVGIGDVVVDVGPGRHNLIGINRPVRGQTGWNWKGKNDCFRLAPEEFGGIEFHSDALTDCKWSPTVRLDLPDTLRSGAYALKLTTQDMIDGDEQYIPFFVRPAKPSAKICFLVPTASYLAYANGRSHMEADASQVILARVPVLQQSDLDGVDDNCLFGLSTYDTHVDGAGVCYTSARRPIFTMHPKYRVPGVDCAWQFPADLSVIAFLEHYGFDYEILTDEDLDREGVAAIASYDLVINGTHCEYYSEKMLDATEDYLAQGGSVTYLSGNGYYWVVAFRPDEPGIMEVRKLDSGSRAWQARPGECYMATTGERGGIWRLRGRPPQKLVATGFASEGMDRSFPYQRLEGSRDPAVSWIFDGIDQDTIGDFGLAHGGAVGLEIDRCDSRLGSPPNTKILASSGPLTENWQLVAEDVMFMYPGMGGDQHPLVRCDMTYYETNAGGAVFSPSSIAWGSALPVNGFDNDVSRIMRNVVQRLAKVE